MKTFEEAVDITITKNRADTCEAAMPNVKNLLIKYPFWNDIRNHSELAHLFAERTITVSSLVKYDKPDSIFNIFCTIFYLGLIAGIEMEKEE